MLFPKTLNFANSISLKIPKFIKNLFIRRGKVVLVIDSKNVIFVLNFLKNHVSTQFNVLVDLSVIDRFSIKNRFEIYYFLRSTNYNIFISLVTFNDGFLPLSSAIPLYNGANWLEREIWDMFGIFFSNHPDLRRILTDYGFQGFPLRKDFPLSGFIETRYDDETKRVTYDLVELSQEFRFFDFQSPWQNSEFSKI
ncbi:MAG TPA: NADH-quinone oxidoreductase subunit C [Bacteroidia bacterium]|nr:NADH-quinone oxidoreductase subunit C [Bacteroidia bacterium]